VLSTEAFETLKHLHATATLLIHHRGPAGDAFIVEQRENEGREKKKKRGGSAADTRSNQGKLTWYPFFSPAHAWAGGASHPPGAPLLLQKAFLRNNSHFTRQEVFDSSIQPCAAARIDSCG
jgi:hypothetical protein